MKKFRLRFRLIVCLALASFSGQVHATLAVDAAPLTVMRAVLGGQTSDVERYFGSVSKNAGRGQSDYDAYLAFEIFNNTNPALEAPLDGWIAAYPGSAYGLTARGLYRYAVAMQLRGEEPTSKTPREKLDAMQVHLNQALSDLKAAHQKAPTLSIASAALVRVYKIQGDRAKLESVARDALRITPGSFAVRKAHLGAQVPKWGGTFENLVAAVDDADRESKNYPDLEKLQGFAHATLANGYYLNGDHDKAREFGNEAVAMGLDDAELLTVAQIFFHEGDFARADELLDKALALYPARLKSLLWKGRIAEQLGDDAAAEVWYARALVINPVNVDALHAHARLLAEKGKIKQAEANYMEAMSYFGAQDPEIVNDYLYMLVSKAKNFNRAKTLAEQSRHLFADSRNLYWYSYGVALAGLKDCRTVSAMKRYQQNCAGTERLCNAAALRGAEQQIRAVVDPGRCDDAPALTFSGTS